MTVGQRLKEVRGRITLREFAEPLNVTPTQISTIENDRSGLSVELSIKIAKIYKVSLDWLLLGEEKPAATPQLSEGEVIITKDQLIALQEAALKGKDEQIAQLRKQVKIKK